MKNLIVVFAKIASLSPVLPDLAHYPGCEDDLDEVDENQGAADAREGGRPVDKRDDVFIRRPEGIVNTVPWFQPPSQLLGASVGVLQSGDGVAALLGDRLARGVVVLGAVGPAATNLPAAK